MTVVSVQEALLSNFMFGFNIRVFENFRWIILCAIEEFFMVDHKATRHDPEKYDLFAKL